VILNIIKLFVNKFKENIEDNLNRNEKGFKVKLVFSKRVKRRTV